MDDFGARLLEATAPVTDREAARASVHDGVRRRHRVRRAAAVTAVAAVTAAAIGIGATLDLLPDDQAPVIGSEPLPACVGEDAAERVGGYLAEWTDGEQPVEEPSLCLLRGAQGPEPEFDTSGLGSEQVVDLTTAPDRGQLPGVLRVPEDSDTFPSRAAPGYPAIHLGSIIPPTGGQDGGLLSDDPEHRFALWRELSGEIAFDVGGGAFRELVPSAIPVGIAGASSTRPLHDITVVTLPETAVVSLEIDGEPIAWQRPVARLATLPFLDPRPLDDVMQELVVRQLAADGTELALHQGPG